MTAAKISLKEGHVRGIMFSVGACVVVIIQTTIAAVFARYLSKNHDVIDVLQCSFCGFCFSNRLFFVYSKIGT